MEHIPRNFGSFNFGNFTVATADSYSPVKKINPISCSTTLSSWRRVVVVSGVRRMNEVNARRARLVPGWVTVFGRVYHLGM